MPVYTPTEDSSRGGPGDERPYCWQNVAALDAIRTAKPARKSGVTQALAVYGALTEISARHEKRQPTFRASVAAIAAKAGMSYNTAREAIRTLVAVGVLTVEPGQRKDDGKQDQSRFTLTTNRRHSVPTGRRHSVSTEPTSQCAENIPSLPKGREKGTKRNEKALLSKAGFSTSSKPPSSKPFEDDAGDLS